MSSAPELVSALKDEVGDNLRSVSTYREDDFELHYMREDVASIYSEAEMDRVFDDLVLQGLGRDVLEEMFHAGEFECSMYGFEEAAMFHFVENGYSGLFVTFNRKTDFNLDSLIATCKGALSEP